MSFFTGARQKSGTADRRGECPTCQGVGFIPSENGGIAKPCPDCAKGQRMRQALKTPRRAKRQPPVCETCGGAGVYQYDVPFDHPLFTKTFSCPNCEAGRERERRIRAAMFRNSGVPKRLADWRLGELASQHPDVWVSAQSLLNKGYIAADDGWRYHGLFLYGPTGTGKTTLAAALANEFILATKQTLFTSVPGLLADFRAAFGLKSDDGRQGEFEKRFHTAKTVPVLVLDDLGTESPTGFALEKLWMIADYRFNENLMTIVTSNLSPEKMAVGDPQYGRVVSRLAGLGFPIEISGADWRMPGKGN